MTERKWRFGTMRIDLDGAEFGLDEDGWIECRTRFTARDLETVMSGGSQFAFLPALVTGWSIKADGEAVPFDRDEVLDLPIEVLVKVFEELQKQPFFAKYVENEEATTATT